MSRPITVLLADDHAIVRRGLRELLETHGGFKIIAEAKTGIEAVEMAKSRRPDVAVLDIRMPTISGIEACRQIRDSVVACKVIMLTAYAEDELLFAAIEAGAIGYILKQAVGYELIQAIEHIGHGEGILDSSMTMSVINRVRRAAELGHRAEFDVLSSQEMLVLVLVSKGKTNRAIASDLYLSEGTIRNYVSSILEKLSVHNRAQAAAFAIRHKLDELLAEA
jgi:two-component system, NarL family, response regulator DevR